MIKRKQPTTTNWLTAISWESTVPSVTSQSDKSQVGLVSCHFAIKYHHRFYFPHRFNFSFRALFQQEHFLPLSALLLFLRHGERHVLA